MVSESSDTKFALNGDLHIAYQVFGDGAIDLLHVAELVHHVDAVWEFPEYARMLRRLGSFARVIQFDRRGTGLSDPVSVRELPDLETQVDDVVAVLDAVGSERPAIFGSGDGCLIAMLLAATHPDRCASLALFLPAAMQAATSEHPIGFPPEAIEGALHAMKEGMVGGDAGLPFLAPSRLGDDRFASNLTKLQRASVRPGVLAHFYEQTMRSDVRSALPVIRVPTLVVHRTESVIQPVELGREVASLIPAARLIEVPGTDSLLFSGDTDRVIDEVEEFLTGARSGGDAERVLATLLFTDIVESTRTAAEVGDRQWRDLLDEHDRLVRRELERFRGREVVTTGDGFLATFDGPGRAVRCALAITEVTVSAGIRVRAGIHTGEVELRGNDVGGLAVHIAARVSALAGPGEVLVSSTVKDLLVGSGVDFEGRGEKTLKGVPGTWRLFAVAATA
jgi:class 3 adenylate cyclase